MAPESLFAPIPAPEPAPAGLPLPEAPPITLGSLPIITTPVFIAPGKMLADLWTPWCHAWNLSEGRSFDARPDALSSFPCAESTGI